MLEINLKKHVLNDMVLIILEKQKLLLKNINKHVLKNMAFQVTIKQMNLKNVY